MTAKLCRFAIWRCSILIGGQGQGCPSNQPWRTAGRSWPMLDAARKTHILSLASALSFALGTIPNGEAAATVKDTTTTG